ncbi:MAG: phosphoglycolate phosphatase [Pseudooceanicola sp.]
MSARIVFDLDGTLIDSAPDIRGIANALLEGEGRAPITLSQTREFIGNGAGTFVARMRAARDIPEADHARLLADFVAGYDTAVTLTAPYPGVPEILARLARQGHRLGICTNKPARATLSVLSHLALDGHFATIWGGDSLPVHKPDPAPLRAALDALEEGPAIYVGDSEVDAETAQRAGIPFVLFTEGYRKGPVATMPHTEAFSDFAALPAIVDRLLAGVDAGGQYQTNDT